MLKTKQKIALAAAVQEIVMSIRRLLGKGPETRVRRGEINWDLDLREGIDFSIWLLGAFEPRTVRYYQKLLQGGDVVLDIGANVGAHTLPLARAVGPSGMVYAFEPTDYAFAKLTKNCSLNPKLIPRIRCMQYMLVDSDGVGATTPGLYASWPLKRSEDLHKLHQGRLMETTGAEARTLDSVVRSLNLDRVDCVKLDIDGFECAMLRGAREVLRRWKPVIILELAPYALAEQGATVAELLHLLSECDYRLRYLSNGALLASDPRTIEAQIPPGASVNVIARPESM